MLNVRIEEKMLDGLRALSRHLGEPQVRIVERAIIEELDRLDALPPKPKFPAKVLPIVKPIDMMIFCPDCNFQHIDAPDPTMDWDNPPHTSHLCLNCKVVFRLADIPTNGVACIKSVGSRDTWHHPTSACWGHSARGNPVTELNENHHPVN